VALVGVGNPVFEPETQGCPTNFPAAIVMVGLLVVVGEEVSPAVVGLVVVGEMVGADVAVAQISNPVSTTTTSDAQVMLVPALAFTPSGPLSKPE